MKYSIYVQPPTDFQPTVEVAACYCEWENKLLLVKRHPNKPQGNTWGVPAGKMEIGESPIDTIKREVFEEVGLILNSNTLLSIGKLYCRLPHIDYIYHMFSDRFESFPQVTLCSQELLESKWVTFSEAKTLPLIAGGLEALNFYKFKTLYHE